MTDRPLIERRIRASGLLITAGLIVQLFSLTWSHPLAFMAFLFVGTPFVLIGTLLYLYSLLRGTENTTT